MIFLCLMFDRMAKKLFSTTTLWTAILISILSACSKEDIISSKDALLFTSTDTLSFGQLFTGSGSVTQSFKIFNGNDQKLLLNSLSLSGGSNSVFLMNVNGVQGESFSNIEIAAGDSIYVFVSTLIPPTGMVLPFLVRDSIGIAWNNNQQFVQLNAEGRNARWLKGGTILSDTSFSNDLPIVVQGPLTIAQGATLSIAEGTSIYFDANAALLVNGSLRATGNFYDSTRIRFSGSRLDEPYNTFPGSWPGIIFSKSSYNNQLEYVSIINGISGIQISGNGQPQLRLNGCVIDNQLAYGIAAINSNIDAINCQISNCQINNIYLAGGAYNFTHCTVVTYSNFLIAHDGPVAFLTDQDDQLNQYALSGNFTNCIFYGSGGLVDNEITTAVAGAGVNTNFLNVFYSNSAEQAGVQFENSLNNTEPGFNLIDFENNVFDFSLSPVSPCNNNGIGTTVIIDILGRRRSDQTPDIGCFEVE